MPRRREHDAEQARYIRERAQAGESAAEIYRGMRDAGLFDRPHPVLSERTVQSRVAELRPPDTSGPWQFNTETDPAEASAVLPVAAFLAVVSGGRIWPTIDEARQIARIRNAVPDVPPDWAYGLARGYLRNPAGDEHRLLDVTLGTAPWRDDSHEAHWERAIQAVMPDSFRRSDWLPILLVDEFDEPDSTPETPQ